MGAVRSDPLAGGGAPPSEYVDAAQTTRAGGAVIVAPVVLMAAGPQAGVRAAGGGPAADAADQGGGGLGDALTAAALPGAGVEDHASGLGGIGARGQAALRRADPPQAHDSAGGGGEYGCGGDQAPAATAPLGAGVPGDDVVGLGGSLRRRRIWVLSRGHWAGVQIRADWAWIQNRACWVRACWVRGGWVRIADRPRQVRVWEKAGEVRGRKWAGQVRAGERVRRAGMPGRAWWGQNHTARIRPSGLVSPVPSVCQLPRGPAGSHRCRGSCYSRD